MLYAPLHVAVKTRVARDLRQHEMTQLVPAPLLRSSLRWRRFVERLTCHRRALGSSCSYATWTTRWSLLNLSRRTSTSASPVLASASSCVARRTASSTRLHSRSRARALSLFLSFPIDSILSVFIVCSLVLYTMGDANHVRRSLEAIHGKDIFSSVISRETIEEQKRIDYLLVRCGGFFFFFLHRRSNTMPRDAARRWIPP